MIDPYNVEMVGYFTKKGRIEYQNESGVLESIISFEYEVLDINECATNNQLCNKENMMCKNTNGSYICVCKDGYEASTSCKESDEKCKSKVECFDKNECFVNNKIITQYGRNSKYGHDCNINSYCINTNGGYSCNCSKK